MDIIYGEWETFFHSSKAQKIEKINSGISQNHSLPATFVLMQKKEIIGSFTIKENDCEAYEANPWLACVIIKKEHRGKGFGKILLNYISQTIKAEGYKEMHLTTLLTGFYEKIGFKFVELVDKNGEINRLYKYDIKK